MSSEARRRGGFWWRLPLRWRIAGALLALFALVLAGLGTLITVTQEQTLLQSQATALRDEAVVATRAITGHALGVVGIDHPPQENGGPPGGPGAMAGDLANQAQAIVRRLASPDLRVTVYAPQGTVLATSDDLGLDLPPAVTLDPATVQAALNTSSQSQSYQLLDGAGQRQLVVLLALADGSGPVAVLALNTPTAPLDASVAAVRAILGIGIGVALALAALLMGPVVRVALRPLVQMEHASQRIAAGAFTARLDVPPTRDEIGRLAAAFNTMTAQLDDLFRRQKQFVADASHELRTPLTALRGGLEVLLLGAAGEDPAATRRLMQGMYAETGRMQRLIDDLLTLSRLDDGRLTLRRSSIVLADFLAQIADEARHLATGQTIILTTTLPTEQTIQADPDRLKQVLLNLLSNAIKFTPPDGTITLAATRATNGAIQISVHDTGSGIAPDALPHVFDRFFRADAARTRSPLGEGSGLGLPIARGLVVAHGGTLALQSAPGTGTTATVTLPKG
jgi:two-component system OmpR family sensor kinase